MSDVPSLVTDSTNKSLAFTPAQDDLFLPVSFPDLSLIILIGPSGAGKSYFARKNFRSSSIVSLENCYEIVSDRTESKHTASCAFDILCKIVENRLKLKRLTVIDADNLVGEDRGILGEIAQRWNVPVVAIIFNIPFSDIIENNIHRVIKVYDERKIQKQINKTRNLKDSLSKRKSYKHVYEFTTSGQVSETLLRPVVLDCNKRSESGPFDIIGDIHGCGDELEKLLGELGYGKVPVCDSFNIPRDIDWTYSHNNGRRVIFVGDIGDRGPRIIDSYDIVRRMVLSGHAFCLLGNHERAVAEKLRGKNKKLINGLEKTWAEIESLSDDIRPAVCNRILDLISKHMHVHLVLDMDQLVVAHAGLPEDLHGRESGKVWNIALYGVQEVDPETGKKRRSDWASQYHGESFVVYGHTPHRNPVFKNNTCNIDTGACFGGSLSALRWPEREIVSVKSAMVYYQDDHGGFSADSDVQSSADYAVLDYEDICGEQIIETPIVPKIQIRQRNSDFALEHSSRWAVDPRWLIYLPPTISPCQTSSMSDYLEHPVEAIQYYHSFIPTVVFEEKHMGSRAIVVVLNSGETAKSRFGFADPLPGCIYTRMGRPFFDAHTEIDVLTVFRDALEKSGVFEALQTDWVALDCEIMPWSAKATGLIKKQYAAAGVAGSLFFSDAIDRIDRAGKSGKPVGELLALFGARHNAFKNYNNVFANYCWGTSGISGLKIAPFEILASEGAVHAGKQRSWHHALIDEICCADSLDILQKTKLIIVDTNQASSIEAAVSWWNDLTSSGGEGVVVKPYEFPISPELDFQPAIKCRGREYLRIIYGPEYTLVNHLARLKKRSLSRKRDLAMKEFSLGVEGLRRFVSHDPLTMVHQCAFGVMALEGEFDDPRL